MFVRMRGRIAADDHRGAEARRARARTGQHERTMAHTVFQQAGKLRPAKHGDETHLVAAGNEDAGHVFEQTLSIGINHGLARSGAEHLDLLKTEIAKCLCVNISGKFRVIGSDGNDQDARFTAASQRDELTKQAALVIFIFSPTDDDQMPTDEFGISKFFLYELSS